MKCFYAHAPSLHDQLEELRVRTLERVLDVIGRIESCSDFHISDEAFKIHEYGVLDKDRLDGEGVMCVKT